MVLRYVHPQARHQAEAVMQLEAVNATKEIEEIDRLEKGKKTASDEMVPTVFTTLKKARPEAEPLTH